MISQLDADKRGMGELILLAERRAAPGPPPSTRERIFYVDLTNPFSYLDGDRVERTLGEAQWRPARAPIGLLDLLDRIPAACSPQLQELAERRAEEQRLPLTWPEHYGRDCTRLHRAAAYATAEGRGGAFAMSALRLGFSGGFDLADPFVLEEAATAAGLPVEPCIAAAADPRWDDRLAANYAELTAAGVADAPAIRVGERWFAGRQAVAEAGAELSGVPGPARLGVFACS